MLGINMQGVEAAGGNRPGAGGYVIRITNVMNRRDKEYLEIEYDIAEGEFREYYRDLFERRKFWLGKFRRSYKQNALPFFLQFMEVIEDSNNGAPGLIVEIADANGEPKKDVDESKLPGCLLGMVCGMEEYIGNDGRLKTRFDHFNAEFMTPDRIRAGEFTVPELKRLQDDPTQAAETVVDTTAGFGPVRDDDLPFA